MARGLVIKGLLRGSREGGVSEMGGGLDDGWLESLHLGKNSLNLVLRVGMLIHRLRRR